MMLARAIEGNALALSFVCNYCSNQTSQFNHAIKLLENKMNSYEKWNTDYPGFAGFLPWYNNTDEGCTPNQGWVNYTLSFFFYFIGVLITQFLIGQVKSSSCFR